MRSGGQGLPAAGPAPGPYVLVIKWRGLTVNYVGRERFLAGLANSTVLLIIIFLEDNGTLNMVLQ